MQCGEHLDICYCNLLGSFFSHLIVSYTQFYQLSPNCGTKSKVRFALCPPPSPAPRFRDYPDYLDSLIAEEDIRYLQDGELARYAKLNTLLEQRILLF